MSPKRFLAAGVLLGALLPLVLVAAKVSASGSGSGGIAFSTPTLVDPWTFASGRRPGWAGGPETGEPPPAGDDVA